MSVLDFITVHLTLCMTIGSTLFLWEDRKLFTIQKYIFNNFEIKPNALSPKQLREIARDRAELELDKLIDSQYRIKIPKINHEKLETYQ